MNVLGYCVCWCLHMQHQQIVQGTLLKEARLQAQKCSTPSVVTKHQNPSFILLVCSLCLSIHSLTFGCSRCTSQLYKQLWKQASIFVDFVSISVVLLLRWCVCADLLPYFMGSLSSRGFETTKCLFPIQEIITNNLFGIFQFHPVITKALVLLGCV